MDLNLYQYYEGNLAASILIALAIIFLVGFLFSKITKLLHLPNVTGYILAGIIIGPFVLDLVDPSFISSMGFLSDLCLGFIAFGVGKFFKKEALKKTGGKVIVITLFEALLAGLLVFLIIYFAFPSLGWSFALLLGAIATATAPASTLMTINQYQGKGEFVETLLAVVALDDVVCLLAFSIVSSVVQSLEGGSINALEIILPIIYNIAFLLVGLLAGYVLAFLKKGRSPNSQLIIAVCLIALISGLCIYLDISPLLSCMVFGATYINFTKDEKLFKYLDHFTPPLMLLFFVNSGMNMDFSSFALIGLVGVTYFLVRLVGKYGGAYLGAKITRSSKETRRYLGLALAPQAGVAIGLAFLGQRMLPSEIGDTFLSIILCSSVLYEIAGPILAKTALIKSGAIPKESFKKKKKGEQILYLSHDEVREANDVVPLNEHLEVSGDWRKSRHGGYSYLPARGPTNNKEK